MLCTICICLYLPTLKFLCQAGCVPINSRYENFSFFFFRQTLKPVFLHLFSISYGEVPSRVLLNTTAALVIMLIFLTLQRAALCSVPHAVYICKYLEYEHDLLVVNYFPVYQSRCYNEIDSHTHKPKGHASSTMPPEAVISSVNTLGTLCVFFTFDRYFDPSTSSTNNQSICLCRFSNPILFFYR